MPLLLIPPEAERERLMSCGASLAIPLEYASLPVEYASLPVE